MRMPAVKAIKRELLGNEIRIRWLPPQVGASVATKAGVMLLHFGRATEAYPIFVEVLVVRERLAPRHPA